MKVKLLDSLGYLVHTAEVADCPRVVIWGDRVYVKVSRRTYREQRHVVIADTRGNRLLH